MRLSRRSDGTYGFQYVADESALLEAEDRVNELSNNLYEFDKERYSDVLDEAYDLYVKYIERRKEIGADGVITEDEKKELEAIGAELDKVSSRIPTLFANIGDSVANMYPELSEEEISTNITANVVDTTGSIATLVNKFAGLGIEEVLNSYTSAIDTEWTDVIEPKIASLTNTLDPDKEGSLGNHLAKVKKISEGVVQAFSALANPTTLKGLEDALSTLKTNFANLTTAI